MQAKEGQSVDGLLGEASRPAQADLKKPKATDAENAVKHKQPRREQNQRPLVEDGPLDEKSRRKKRKAAEVADAPSVPSPAVLPAFLQEVITGASY